MSVGLNPYGYNDPMADIGIQSPSVAPGLLQAFNQTASPVALAPLHTAQNTGQAVGNPLGTVGAGSNFSSVYSSPFNNVSGVGNLSSGWGTGGGNPLTAMGQNSAATPGGLGQAEGQEQSIMARVIMLIQWLISMMGQLNGDSPSQGRSSIGQNAPIQSASTSTSNSAGTGGGSNPPVDGGVDGGRPANTTPIINNQPAQGNTENFKVHDGPNIESRAESTAQQRLLPSGYLGATPDMLTNYQMPVDGPPSVTSHVGDSRSYGAHEGTDFGVPEGTTVKAAFDGSVIEAGWVDNGYGYRVKIQHPDGNISNYAHLSSINQEIKDSLKAGQAFAVKKGQPIGLSGNTGNSTGPHLHFDIQRGGQYYDSSFVAKTNQIATGNSGAPNTGGGAPMYSLLRTGTNEPQNGVWSDKLSPLPANCSCSSCKTPPNPPTNRAGTGGGNNSANTSSSLRPKAAASKSKLTFKPPVNGKDSKGSPQGANAKGTTPKSKAAPKATSQKTTPKKDESPKK
jgi:murein DD-endopeptidase MepM/ murein hydrolase activator NlpD